jgi:hypothetical protein
MPEKLEVSEKRQKNKAVLAGREAVFVTLPSDDDKRGFA